MRKKLRCVQGFAFVIILTLSLTAMAINDALILNSPGDSKLRGLLGTRIAASESARLLKVDEDVLLDGFRHRPGKHPWIGEHVGKWLHAATLTWAYTQNPELRAKIDRVASELIKTQEADGYLGTYEPEKRFALIQGADWDVWSHKYNLIGLLTHYEYTHSKESLEACKKIGDLLIATFGENKKSILSAGTHMGMASTSVLEPMVLLHRATQDPRYLDFALYIVRSWEEEKGPKIISRLLKEHTVRKVGNAKAYEMLSNFVGLCELYRSTGDKKYLDPVLIAWDDITQNRLFITGSGSNHEFWQATEHTPCGDKNAVAETCVTTTWLQLNRQLLRITGEARFADQLELTIYNHLLAAQREDGGAWCYFTPLDGNKKFRQDTNCCLSSGPRGVALIPSMACGRFSDGVAINFYVTGDLRIPGEQGDFCFEMVTNYPVSGGLNIAIKCAPPAESTLRLRPPTGAKFGDLKINGRKANFKKDKNGYLSLRRNWKAGDKMSWDFDLTPRCVRGKNEQAGSVAVMLGPLVLAADQKSNSAISEWSQVKIKDAGKVRKRTDGTDWFVETRGKIGDSLLRGRVKLRLVPFYAAGQHGDEDANPYQVWFRSADAPKPKIPKGASLFTGGVEDQSREGNTSASFADGNPETFSVTFQDMRAESDWFSVAAHDPVKISRVVYTHGKSFHDGGWFDASAGKPRVEIRESANGDWIPVGELKNYPATSATDSAGLKGGEKFEARFPSRRALAIRIIGKPACGDSPKQAFVSCGELQGYRD